MCVHAVSLAVSVLTQCNCVASVLISSDLFQFHPPLSLSNFIMVGQ